MVAYADFKTREVSVILLFCYSFLVAVDAIMSATAKITGLNFASNLGFVFLLFLCTTLYISIRNKKFVLITNGFMGWADVWIILVLALPFYWANYILFITVSFIIALLFHVVFSVFRKSPDRQIPLAAYLVINYAVLRLIIYFYGYDLFDESLIVSFLQP